MSWNNKVLWSEGLFLQPQHFQQHDRYIEHLVRSQLGLSTPYPWGVNRLRLDDDLLTMGKLAIAEAAGVFPDGTPFNIPADDPPPQPLELDETIGEQTIYLALALRQPGEPESGTAADAPALLRYRVGELEVRDNIVGAQTETSVEVGRLAVRLLLEKENRSGFAHIGVARVAECRTDKRIVLDDAYVPPCLDFQVSPRLESFAGELLGLLHHRAESLASRVSASGRGGVAEWADFLLLQVINRHEPLTAHLTRLQGLHPEGLYRLLLSMAGELSTFTTTEKRPPTFPDYRHDDLAASFAPVMAMLRDALSKILEERAIPISIEEGKYGYWRTAVIADRGLLSEATFVLAAHAKVNPEFLRNRFPAQVKIGPVEKIQDLVKHALPGIALHPLPVAPRQIPFHAGFAYFELDGSSEYWPQLEASSRFAFHVGGEFPDLELEFWAIRE
jgi:type VI secretion system protein ImpJ